MMKLFIPTSDNVINTVIIIFILLISFYYDCVHTIPPSPPVPVPNQLFSTSKL
jgi:hypothetical protein